jgi:CheY-like chemotaxis protein
MLVTLLKEWAYTVVEAEDGEQAAKILCSDDAPSICILDWMMPGRDGVDVCREIRSRFPSRPLYFLLLTVKTRREDMLAALQAGADDFLSKPFDYEELRVRIEVGKRVVNLQEKLERRADELQEALSKVKTLSDLLPICAHCHKIRDDEGYWSQVDAYVSKHLDVQFSHGLCPACAKELYPDLHDECDDIEQS